MNTEIYPKQVIVIRKDLTMRRGKQIAQAAHASMKVILDMMIYDLGKVFPGEYEFEDSDINYANMTLEMRRGSALHEWLNGSFAKICVYVNSEEELLEIYQKAKDAEIPTALITDSGKTEFKGVATNTVVAVGPDWSENIDPITGHLKLL